MDERISPLRKKYEYDFRVKLWDRKDINGFFGLFTNNLSNILVMASLLTVSIGMPDWIVYERILPAAGLSIFLSSLYYTWMAYKLSVKEGRNDITALPSGNSVPHMFLIVFMIMGPVYWDTGNPELAWHAGLAWCFVEGAIEISGSIIGPRVRDTIPRAAMLGALAGVSLTFIAMNPAMQAFRTPYIGLVSLAIILLGWLGNNRMPFNIPVGLFAIIVGTVIGWLTGHMDYQALVTSVSSVQPTYAKFSLINIIDGFGLAAPYLAAAIPLGVYNFFETMDNVESASIAGDDYSVRETLIADGTTSILGSFFGSPFPTAVFIGHPGWKKTGAKLAYTLMTGTAILLITWLNLTSLMLSLIPLVAIVPILLYIGLVIGAQAFTAVDGKYAPAVLLGIIPWISSWSQGNIDTVLGLAGKTADQIGFNALAVAGVEYNGMATLGAGAILVSMIWATLCVYIIDGQLVKAAVTSMIAAALAFVGMIHADGVGIGKANEMVAGYLMIGVLFIIINQLRIRESRNNKSGI
ncbi:xanthine/uracil/vitamin C permease (plasmid) [Peptoclostridium acidaminophilum DSM 3953]|uniref:Xanthine/uracil/vitamin C permease n=1 Tax=Peptoclostridium acidaminophilum DSM 3953 TaxID=1286171 RepID=W8TQ49_PEPAC|nr:xanthine permease [Peptoclostridium acidaminophilum]AHM58217.1 xanthine/uracil/vitamin C permease [Peptoclostridium acidaminophilum DSM 3953]